MKEIIFKNLGVKRNEIVVGPSVGIDGAVIDIGNKSLIISIDPVTGSIGQIGWLAVNINANDVATFGVEPAFFLSSILLPEGASKKSVKEVSSQINRAAINLGIAVVGGHCEVTPGLLHPIVLGCTIGITEKNNYVTAAGARPLDKLVLTKSAGIEGTAILASDREDQLKRALENSMLCQAKEFYKKTSIVEDALTAFNTGGVHAMHDPTEGGVLGGIYEMAEASSLGVKIYEERIDVQSVTLRICEFFNIDPLQLVSSGALLISVDPNLADAVIENLKLKQIYASVIGEFLQNPDERRFVKKNKEVQDLCEPTTDQLWIALGK